MPPLKLVSNETFGQRLARFRKERGLTQIQLAEKVGIIQTIVADYERSKLRLNAEMICRFAQVLGVSADVMLGLKRSESDAVVSADADGGGLSLKLVRRIKRIDQLPTPKQKVLLQTIDGFLKGEGISS